MIVTVTLPAGTKVHDRVEDPDPPAIVVGVSVQAELSVVSATLLVKPFNGVTEIVEVPATPATTLTVVGLAAMLKSGAAVIE